ncbi:MAG: hypothetical protein ACOYOK_12450 [Pseudobdellovibrionaceae bacterium]
MRNKYFYRFILSLFCLHISLLAFAQNKYISKIDQDLTIKQIWVHASSDNVGGSYSQPIQSFLENKVKEDHQWSLVATPQDLLQDKWADIKKLEKVAQPLLAGLWLDARRTPDGINLVMTLYGGGDKNLAIATESKVQFTRFEIPEVLKEVNRLYDSIKNKIPYSGLILSRKGLDVTINLGSKNGLKEHDRLSVIQILQIQRHPKHQFIVQTEKEILGQIEIFKVDTTLSFAKIISEKESGVIQTLAKVLSADFIKYPSPITDNKNVLLNNLNQRNDQSVAFGESPKSWSPEDTPQYGKVYFLAGLAETIFNSKLNTAGVVEGKDSFSPHLLAGAELWITSKWSADFNLKKSIFTIKNDLAGSSPTDLAATYDNYEFKGIYKMLLDKSYLGPQFSGSFGFYQSKFNIGGSSPVAHASTEYSGLLLGLAGQFPVSDYIPWIAGAELKYAFNPSASDSPSSGKASAIISSFNFFSSYQIKQNVIVKGLLGFDYYNIDFSGSSSRSDPAKSTTQKITSLLFGIEYLF